MADNFNILQEHGIVEVQGFDIGGGSNLDGVMIKEIMLSENILTPGLQTFVRLHSTIYSPAGKNFDQWKNTDMSFNLSRGGSSLRVNQKAYRLSDRHFMPTNVGVTEEMTVHACDKTLLEDAKCLVSKSWKCTKPSEIVDYVLGHCVKSKQKDVQSADPARDYIAENIHPFQVIAQQANVAVDGDDPSFVHYMTYENGGKHHFKSLKKLTSAGSVKTYRQADVEDATGYANDEYAINFMFPCDFDYLTDLLNGVDENGKDQNTGGFMNPVFKIFQKLSSSSGNSCDCGIGNYNYKMGLSNKATAKDQNSCNLDTETHLLKRQARMALLDRDRIALRITVPCNLNLHVGKIITLDWKNKFGGGEVYGSGEYLITSMTHNIKLGGFSVTTMDCVSKTVGQGVV